MVENDRRIETTREFFAERKAVERRLRQVDGDDRAAIGVDHTADGDADPKRRAARRGESSRNAVPYRFDHFGAAPCVRWQRLLHIRR